MPESPGLARRTQVLIDDATAGFVGRTYVFDQIESFIAENRSGYFRLTADPGEGKTAIMAEYVRRTGCVAHFNVLSETYNNTAQFTQHVATQLVARRLIADAESPADGGVGVADLLIEARAALSPPERLVLVVDALDEADRRDLPPTANVLLLPRTLPPAFTCWSAVGAIRMCRCGSAPCSSTWTWPTTPTPRSTTSGTC